MKTFQFFFCLLCSILFIGPSHSAEKSRDPSFAKYFALPPLQPLDRKQLHTLRIGFVEDPNFTILKDAQIAGLFKIIESMTRDKLGYLVKMKLVWRKPMAQFYAIHQNLAKIPAMAQLLDYDIDMSSKTAEPQLRYLSSDLFKRHGPDKISEYLSTPGTPSANSLFEQFKNLQQTIAKTRSPNDTAICSSTHREYHSFWWLDVILHNIKDADFIFVNQLVCNPDSDMPLYVMARGGVNTGAVESNIYNSFHAAGFVSLYPFFPVDPFFEKMTGPIPAQERIQVAGTYTTHELGHLLDRRAEIYDHEHCVSKAAVSLNYYKWYQDIQAGQCHKPHPQIQHY